eukprot:gnl/TRDRNA2_/TRDRNA2_104668_c0_seq2.p1 gnl/TRDRNA2_/TRDRNA2_104668_c0~~gnl/TRDRNA2_/TRDRNA2_104668_c0_seq2.p1  ORF type:complete len:104 (+),score=25.86 gnl/TRDRNA2_/TRDRNA2_104668_c0_seq2:30-314(+)
MASSLISKSPPAARDVYWRSLAAFLKPCDSVAVVIEEAWVIAEMVDGSKTLLEDAGANRHVLPEIRDTPDMELAVLRRPSAAVCDRRPPEAITC